MAIYHCSFKTVKKSAGQSSAAKRAYIERDEKYSRNADRLTFSKSGNMPDWAESPRQFWEAADTYERDNGRLAVTYECSLPRELNQEQREALALDFAHRLTAKKKLPYTLALHEGRDKRKGSRSEQSEPHNPHLHIMINERSGDEISREMEDHFKRANKKNPALGGAAKVDLTKKQTLLDARKLWADCTNQHLERAGSEARIDHRSNLEQGIKKAPGLHQGPGRFNRGIQARKDIQRFGKKLDKELQNRKKEELSNKQKLMQDKLNKMRGITNELNEKAKEKAEEKTEINKGKDHEKSEPKATNRRRFNRNNGGPGI